MWVISRRIWAIIVVAVLLSPLLTAHDAPSKPYLDPTEPTFLGLLIMISLYKSLKR